MALNAFADKAHQPTERDLRSVLGKAFPAWIQLIELVSVVRLRRWRLWQKSRTSLSPDVDSDQLSKRRIELFWRRMIWANSRKKSQ